MSDNEARVAILALQRRVAELESHLDDGEAWYHEGLTLRARVVQLEKLVRQGIGMAEDVGLTCQRFLEPLRACVEKAERELCHVLDELDAFPQPASNRIDRLRERVRAFCTEPMASVSEDAEQDSPNFTPLSADELKAIGFKRVNRYLQTDGYAPGNETPDNKRVACPIEALPWTDEEARRYGEVPAAHRIPIPPDVKEAMAEVRRLREVKKATPTTFEVDMGACSNEATVAEESARGREAWFAGGPGATFKRSEEQRSNEVQAHAWPIPVLPDGWTWQKLNDAVTFASTDEARWRAIAVRQLAEIEGLQKQNRELHQGIARRKKASDPRPGQAVTEWRVLVNDEGEPYAVDNGTFRREVDTDGNVAPRSDYPRIDFEVLRKSGYDALVERNIVLAKENVELRRSVREREFRK